MRKLILPGLIIMAAIVLIYLLFGSSIEEATGKWDLFAMPRWEFAILSFIILSSDILLPIPSSILMIMNGFALGIIGGSVVSMLSLIASAWIGYYLGRIPRRNPQKIDDAQAISLLDKFGPFAIIISRPIPIFSETISLLCGYNAMPFKRYMLYMVIGSAPLAVLYSYFGSVGKDKNSFVFVIIASMLVALLAWIFIYGRARKRDSLNNQ